MSERKAISTIRAVERTPTALRAESSSSSSIVRVVRMQRSMQATAGLAKLLARR